MHAHVLALEIRDAADAFSGKQFEAADVHAGQDRDRFAGIDRNDEGRREVRSEVDLAACERQGGRRPGLGRHIADIGKAFRAQQFLGDILGRDADAGDFRNRMVVVSGGACWAIVRPADKAAPAADESVASKRRRLCLDCTTRRPPRRPLL